MRFYTLYNKKLERPLNHPKIGLWYTNDIKEAEDMLLSCHEYLKSLKIKDLDNFVIIDAKTGEII